MWEAATAFVGSTGMEGEQNCPGIIHPIRAEEKQTCLSSCTDIPKNDRGAVCHSTRAEFSSPHLLSVNKQLLLLALPVPPFNLCPLSHCVSVTHHRIRVQKAVQHCSHHSLPTPSSQTPREPQFQTFPQLQNIPDGLQHPRSAKGQANTGTINHSLAELSCSGSWQMPAEQGHTYFWGTAWIFRTDSDASLP